MKTDPYTKVVLTVIAVCLLLFLIRDVQFIADANAGVPDETITPSGVDYALIPVNEDGSINVRFSASSELDVNIVGVNTGDELEVELVEVGLSDPIDINVEEVGSKSITYGNPIPVEIEN